MLPHSKNYVVGSEFYTTKGYNAERVSEKEERVGLKSEIRFICIDMGVDIGTNDGVYAIFENESIGKIKAWFERTRSGEFDFSPDWISAEKRQEYYDRFGNKIAPDIIQRIVSIGMTPDMVRAAWGNRWTTNKTITAGSNREQWVYDNGKGYSRSYVYFENGKVTAIQ